MWGGVGIGVDRTNSKISLGVGSGIADAEGANFEIGTPDPRSGGQKVKRGLVGHLIKVPMKWGFVNRCPSLSGGAQRAFCF